MGPFGSFLYLLIVAPIEYIIEASFCLFRNFFSGQAKIPLAIVSLSFLVTLLTFPIYSAADTKQVEEREMQRKLSKWKARIKSAFTGDERFMILSTYYRLNNYSPIYALRGTFSVLVQVPFFIAAYHFLSKCPELSGVKLGPIDDLMKPDALLHFSTVSVNLLPILMTVVNLISGTIFIQGGGTIREKVQVYGLALVFFVLLYGSPSGLVLYWIFNQVFSLAKNLIRNSNCPGHLIKILFCGSLVVFCLYVDFFRPRSHIYKRILFSLFCVVVCFLCLFKKGWIRNFFVNATGEEKHYTRPFVASCAGLFLLVGSVVPLCVLSSDPAAFSFLDDYNSPFLLYRYNLVKAAGLFLLWPVCIYGLSADRWKPLLLAVFETFCFSALLNFYAFSSDFGILSDLLVYEKDDVFSGKNWMSVLNILVLVVVALSVFILIRRKALKILFLLAVAIAVSTTGHSLLEASKVARGYDRAFTLMKKNAGEPIINLSRTGTNVFCIMLDRATGAYLEECFKEDPNLYEQYDGFTFYPNAVSFSNGTLAGSPGLFGGYEYVPAMMQLKDGQSMYSKFAEATFLLPRIFAQNGYASVMTDMSLQDFVSTPFPYESYPEKIQCVFTIGAYAKRWRAEYGFGESIQLETDKKRLLPYGIVRVAPVFARGRLYNEGSYLISYYNLKYEDVAGRLSYEGIDQAIKNYSVLDYLPELTRLSDEGNTFTFLINMLTHCPNVLQVPEYVPSKKITGVSPSQYADDKHYYVNMAALKLVGQWLDYLKENAVYDNTRIIIVSDHGCQDVKRLAVEGYSCMPRGELSCLLLVKDFGSRGYLALDHTFMTNADVPSIAVKGLINSPINPATGNDITKLSLKDPVYGEYTMWYEAFRGENSNTLTIKEDTWYTIHDDIFKSENWGRPSSTEVYENTRASLSAQGIRIEGTSK